MNLLETIQWIKKNGFTDEIRSRFSKDELILMGRILAEYDELGRSDTLESLWQEDFERKPVSIDEFLQDDYYLGQVGRNIYDVWLKDLRHVLSPLSGVREWLIRGSVGGGKTFSAVISILYKIYYLTCFRNPQEFHGLASGSPIVFGLFNVYKYLAMATSYQYLTAWLRDLSPYFRSLRGPEKKTESDKQVLRFPKNIQIALGSTSINALGMNLYGGLPLAGDTKIALLNGHNESIKDLVGKEFWVYGLNEDKEFIPALATAFWSKRSRLIAFTLDNGEKIRCSPEHQWMTRDWLYKRADELSVGMCLMPFSKIISNKEIRLVVAVNDLGIEEDVYCLRVPSTSNYAVSAGVISHNCDEADFGKQRSSTSTDKSQIADLYHNVRTRMDSRFMQRGGSNPGLLCLVSSPRDDEQFMVKHASRKESDPWTHISSYALYDIKKHIYEKSERFTVVVGDKFNRSYILEDNDNDEETRPDAKILNVPVEFMEAFRHDIDTAIRDIAGTETYGKSKLLPRPEMLMDCIGTSIPRNHPFSKECISLSLKDDVSIEDYFLKDEALTIYDKTNKIYRPKFFPFADRFIHVDLAKNRDCAGIALSCISETKNIVRYSDETGLPTNARDYVYFIDLMLQVKAVSGSEIDFSKIRKFIFFLMKTCRYKISRISYDSYQSTDSLQTFKKEQNVEAVEFSVDKKPGPYRNLRSIIMEGRLDSYYYDPFFEEFTQLEDFSLEGKHKPLIDHPAGGAKDVCLGGDTKVQLLSGESIAIREIADKGKVWIYSSTTDGQIIPAEGLPRKTGARTDMVRVHLDNGEYVDCTSDHKFLMRDGSYTEALLLSARDSLMPFNRKQKKPKGGSVYYEYTYIPKTAAWRATHLLVRDYILQKEYKSTLADVDGRDFVVVHHWAGSLDNRPDSLEVMLNSKHRKLHGDIFRRYNKSPEKRARLRQLHSDGHYHNIRDADIKKHGVDAVRKRNAAHITAYNKSKKRIDKLKKDGVFSRNGTKSMNALWGRQDFRERHMERALNQSPDHRRRSGERMKMLNRNKDIIEDRKRRGVYKANGSKVMTMLWQCDDFRKRHGERIKNKNEKWLNSVQQAMRKLNRDPEVKIKMQRGRIVKIALRLRDNNLPFSNASEWDESTKSLVSNGVIGHRITAKKVLELFNDFDQIIDNHKVVFVENLNGEEDVYDLTVDKYHNFGLTSGVFVHNSDAVAGSINGALLKKKGVQVTGTDADEMLGRAKKYAEQQKLQVVAAKQSKNDDLANGSYKKKNPLEDFFE